MSPRWKRSRRTCRNGQRKRDHPVATERRNFTQLVTLVPGVSNQTGQDEGTVGINGNVSFSINGGRVEYNNWELDGGDNMDNGSNSTLNVYPSLEAIAEFKVLTSNYGAQYGRNGSGTVEVETKSGTAFHGTLTNSSATTHSTPAIIFGLECSALQKERFRLHDRRADSFRLQQDKQDLLFLVPGVAQGPRACRFQSAFVPSVEERAGDFTDQCRCPMAFCPSVRI